MNNQMQTIGFMTKRQVNAILKQFPSTAQITKSNLIIGVSTPSGEKVFSAALFKMYGFTKWHVRAVPGLIQQANTGV